MCSCLIVVVFVKNMVVICSSVTLLSECLKMQTSISGKKTWLHHVVCHLDILLILICTIFIGSCFFLTSYCRQSCNKKSKKQDGLNQIQGFCLFKDFVMHLHEWSYKLMIFNLMMMVYTVTAHVLHF